MYYDSYYDSSYGSYGSYDTFDAGAAGGLLAGLGIFVTIMWIISIAVSVLTLISMWKIFKKAGKGGWESLIPIYNTIVLIEISGLPMWYIALFFVPFANIYAMFKIYIELAHKFGKSTGFGVGLAFLAPIFLPMLAFGKNTYNGVEATSNVAPVQNYNQQPMMNQMPGQTVAPVTPVVPVAPVEPVAPVAPAFEQPAPVEPVAPVAPVFEQPAPVEPVAPVAPAFEQPAPVEPVAPAAPTFEQPAPVEPVAPVAPTFEQPAPVEPAVTEEPVQPSVLTCQHCGNVQTFGKFCVKCGQSVQ